MDHRLNYRRQIIQCLEGNIGEKFYDLDKDFLDTESKPQFIKKEEKKDKLDFIQVKEEIKYHFIKSQKIEACTRSHSQQMAEHGNELRAVCLQNLQFYAQISKTIPFARHKEGSTDFDSTAVPIG